MPAPENRFKSALASGRMLYGCWAGFADAYATEIVATAGFDWLVIDGEHAPNDLRTIMQQLQVLESGHSAPVVRLPMGEPWAIKQVLDAGAQTLLIPMVESAAQARDLVRATRYPPDGIRGSGAALARPRALRRSTITPPPPMRRSAFWFRWKPWPGLTRLTRSSRLTGWMAYSSALRTSGPTWAIPATAMPTRCST